MAGRVIFQPVFIQLNHFNNATNTREISPKNGKAKYV